MFVFNSSDAEHPLIKRVKGEWMFKGRHGGAGLLNICRVNLMLTSFHEIVFHLRFFPFGFAGCKSCSIILSLYEELSICSIKQNIYQLKIYHTKLNLRL